LESVEQRYFGKVTRGLVAISIRNLIAVIFSLIFFSTLKRTMNIEFELRTHSIGIVGPIFLISLETLLFGALGFIIRQKTEHLELLNNYKTAQFAALKSQLNPHFLFNTLNLISAEIEENPKKAGVLVDQLADLLRAVLQASNRLQSSLRQEVELTQHYLELQKQRFEDRLEYAIEVQENLMLVSVPPLLLQPLVENSIVHGFSKRKESGHIQITATAADEQLCIRVVDNGEGFNTEALDEGNGISIVKDTLALLYGDDAVMKIDSKQAGLSNPSGTVIELRIPLR
jgi:LytS/YehU family sensor histidine kinase